MVLERVCCFRLHTVGILFGWIGAISSFLVTIMLGIALNNIDTIVENVVKENNMDADKARLMITLALCVYLGLTLINLLASVLLIIGTIKERHMMIVPWLINNGFLLLLSITSIIFALFTINEFSAFLSLLPAIIVVLIQYYFWYAIYSLYKKIQSGRDQTQQLIPPAGTSYPSYTKI